MNPKTVTSPRVIKGIFTELQQSGNGLFINEDNTIIKVSIGAGVEDLAEYTICFSEIHDTSDCVTVSFWVGGDYFKCSLKKMSSGSFFPPNEIFSINRREKTRFETCNLSATPVFAVLLINTERVFARVHDVDAECIAISIGMKNQKITIGTHGILTEYSTGSLVGVHNVVVQEVKDAVDFRKRIVLRVTTDLSGEKRITSRTHQIRPILLNLFWPREDGVSALVEVQELTGMGFSGRLITSIAEMLPVGSIFLESASGARLRLAWINSNNAGFSFDCCDPRIRERIYLYLNSFIGSGEKGQRGRTKETLSILTRAGLLKSERALTFSDDEKMEVFMYRSSASQRWLFQDQISEESYLSFVRVSDGGWFIQELGSLSNGKQDGGTLIITGMEKLRNTRHEELCPQSRIAGIYDLSSKFNLFFWRNEILKALSEAPEFHRVTLGTIKGKVINTGGETNTKIFKMRSDMWVSIYSKIKDQKMSNVLSFYGVSENDFAPRMLADVMLSDGKVLAREVYCIQEKNGPVLGVALKIGLPPLANVTSLLENLYIIPTCENHKAIIEAIFENENEVLLGIEDICFIGSTHDDDLQIKKMIPGFTPREFELVLINTHSLKRGT